MLYKKASEMQPTPIPHCMGGEGTVMMERLLEAPAEMLGKGRAYVRHTLAPGVTIGRHTHEHEMESMVIVSGRAVHIICLLYTSDAKKIRRCSVQKIRCSLKYL